MALKELFIIDDDLEDQELFLAALYDIDKSLVYKTAINGEEAYGKLLKKEVSPDLILLDLNMPLLDGAGFLKKIKENEQFKNIPVVIFSTSAVSGNLPNVMDLGASGFVTKPSSFNELQNLLRQTLHEFK